MRKLLSLGLILGLCLSMVGCSEKKEYNEDEVQRGKEVIEKIETLYENSVEATRTTDIQMRMGNNGKSIEENVKLCESYYEELQPLIKDFRTFNVYANYKMDIGEMTEEEYNAEVVRLNYKMDYIKRAYAIHDFVYTNDLSLSERIYIVFAINKPMKSSDKYVYVQDEVDDVYALNSQSFARDSEEYKKYK